MTTLYVATTNPGKLRDFYAAAGAHQRRVLPVPGLNTIPAPREDELTFAGNAIAKAIYYSNYLPGEIVVADDSGLEVDALNGEPGVFSARYAMKQGFMAEEAGYHRLEQDELNNRCLLSNLADIAAANRAARYKCFLAAAKSGECLFTAEGMVEGCVTSAAQGSGGFGYDPLFYLPTLGKTMAELDLETKNSLSHRGKAFSSLLVEMRDKQL